MDARRTCRTGLERITATRCARNGRRVHVTQSRCGIIGAVRAVRLLTLLLVATIAAGPTLLDRCLISCHDESKSDAAPACHEHAAQPSDGLSVHAVDACGHDHDGSPADTVTDARGNAVRHADLVASTAAVGHAEPLCSSGAVLQQRIDYRPSSAFPVLTALRL